MLTTVFDIAVSYAEREAIDLARDERSDLIFLERTRRRCWLRPRFPREVLSSNSVKKDIQESELLSESESEPSLEVHSMIGKESTSSSSSKVMSLSRHASPDAFDSKTARLPALAIVIRRCASSNAAVAGKELKQSSLLSILAAIVAAVMTREG